MYPLLRHQFAKHHDLGNLAEADGARLLYHSGAVRAGTATIAPDDPALPEACRAVKGHALTLSLLGRWLGEAGLGRRFVRTNRRVW